MLLGWEIFLNRSENAYAPRILSISPPRTGRIEYFFGFAFSLDQVDASFRSIQRADPSSDQFRRFKDRWSGSVATATFEADRCDSAEPSMVFLSDSWVGDRTLDWVFLVLLPIDWHDMERPEMLVSESISNRYIRIEKRGNLGGIFGASPSLEVRAAPRERIEAKPGASISLDSAVRSVRSGSTLLSSLAVRMAGRDASGRDLVALNRNETAEVTAQLTMPALLPGERGTSETSHEVTHCDIDGLTRTDNAAQDIKTALPDALPGAVRTRSEIAPTDAFLMDTATGEFEILGNDLSYEGVAVMKDGTVKVLRGTASQRKQLGGLTYLYLTMSRNIAICEDRQIISENASSYEYSAIPTLRTPFKAARWAAANLRPALTPGGVPAPRLATRGPVVRSRVGPGQDGPSTTSFPSSRDSVAV